MDQRGKVALSAPRNRRWAVAAACGVVAAVALYFTFFGKSDEDQIRKALTTLTKSVAVRENENPIARLARIKSDLKDVAADDVAVDVRELDIRVTGRPKLAENATQVAAVYTSASCDLGSLTIKIDPTGNSAKADAVAEVSGVTRGERRSDRRDVHFLLRKDGGWKITSIDVLRQENPQNPSP